jgi:hypothetical protein
MSSKHHTFKFFTTESEYLIYLKTRTICFKLIIVLGFCFRYLGEIDGIDAWKALTEDLPSNRSSVLHNIDDIYGNAALTLGDWKMLKG